MCLAMHPFCDLAEDGTTEDPGDSPPFQVHGPLLQSLVSAGGIVQLEQIIWSLKNEEHKVLPDMVEGEQGVMQQWCYWRNTIPENPNDEPGIEASVANDLGPDD